MKGHRMIGPIVQAQHCMKSFHQLAKLETSFIVKRVYRLNQQGYDWLRPTVEAISCNIRATLDRLEYGRKAIVRQSLRQDNPFGIIALDCQHALKSRLGDKRRDGQQ